VDRGVVVVKAPAGSPSGKTARAIVVLLITATAVIGACGDDGSAGPDAGYSLQDIVADPADVVGKEVVVSGEVGDVFRPHAFTLQSDNGEAVLVVSPDQVVEGSVVRVNGRVVKTPVDAKETSPAVAAFVRAITDGSYEHAVIGREVDRLEGPGESGS
jgi:hypothetical protein